MSKKDARRGHKAVKKTVPPAIVNRRASFDYDLSRDSVVGLSLTGGEVKAARLGRVNLKGAYVVPKENPVKHRSELFLINASFSIANNAPRSEKKDSTTVDTRSRKILAKRREIDELVGVRNTGATIIPTKLLTAGRHIKLVIALGKGKKKYDKRESIKRKDLVRENAKFLKRI
ncbi:SsrA-binding protein [Candidatus Saccharibacteria bacterium]|nr:SsrA-binding protein [Candidatus Saccharibacteria bacterium]MCL1963262.1 SsrA-binding protein [Candidatus Saccharibacteria bacterium]